MKQIVLMYHDVYDRDTKESGFLRERDLPYKVRLCDFEKQVRAIRDYCLSKGIQQNSVVFTFDDGGKSFYLNIAPVLKKYGYKGLFFISTKYIGTETFLNDDEIRALYKAGHIIGSHAHTHEHLYTLSDAEVEYEWEKSVGILSKIIGDKIIYASIPNGDTSSRVLADAYKYGIKHIYTSNPTTNISHHEDMEVIGRYVVLSNSTTNAVLSIIKKSRKRFFLSCKYNSLKVLKSILGRYYVKLKNLFIGNESFNNNAIL